ncbi:DNA mismatch repair protein PMS1, partial [Nosema granulosis]
VLTPFTTNEDIHLGATYQKMLDDEINSKETPFVSQDTAEKTFSPLLRGVSARFSTQKFSSLIKDSNLDTSVLTNPFVDKQEKATQQLLNKLDSETDEYVGFLQSPKSEKFVDVAKDDFKLSTTAFTFLRFLENSTPDIFITKSDFNQMKIIGQFNNGFILTSLKKNERTFLILVDQHAADEIYNYEALQKTMKIQKQKLILPIKLSLTPIEDLYVQENIAVFDRFGFEIKNKEITTIPCLGDVVFNMEDFNGILENLKNDVINFDKLHDIYATKACRSSVMIGENLTHAKMCNVVSNLSRLVNPWKCPHGRPTFIILKEL